ncbi:MAG: LLM class F420-dependent oxidoreductase [Actinomycetota bacterium]
MLISAKLAPCFPYEQLEAFWRAADELGFHAVWNYDHFYGLGTTPEAQRQDTLEGWTTLAAMASVVKRARVGCMVTGVTYRHPAVLAKMAVAVDHISGGRLEFGMGAAWHEPEHLGYGIDFPAAGTRIAMLDEALEVIKKLWTEDTVSFDGDHYTLRDAFCLPKPVQRPRPPIVVGGSGPRKTLRVVARHADEWNTPGHDPEEFSRLSGILDEHCAAIGRDPSQIRRSVQLFVHPAQEGQIEKQIASLPVWEQAGCEHVVLSFYQPPTRAQLERCAPR